MDPISGRDFQEERWKLFINQWIKADGQADTIVIGDTNVDKIKWDTPDQEISPLVELMKNKIETLGYIQLVKNATRFWINTRDSLVDQLWTKTPDKIYTVETTVEV